jgi:hypothetical protein
MANSAARPITDITAEYTATLQAIQAILGGAQSFEMASGGGSTRVMRADLPTLIKNRKDLWDELVEANDENLYGTTNIGNVIFRRIL